MPIKKIVGLTLFIQLLFCCQKTNDVRLNSYVIPLPQSQILNDGQFILDGSTTINFPDEFNISGNFLKNFIAKGSVLKNEDNANIEFILDPNIKNSEGYSLEITANKIKIKATSDQGAFYAVQTLRQLMPSDLEKGGANVEPIKIPCQIIEDYPRFKYRGMHLDVGRHMYSVAFIKKYIDALAMLKMNTFHWHLTEDQGWRIEIKTYPKLNEIAAFRNETLIGHYSDQPHQFDGQRYGGYYSQEEVKEIVAYALKRHVTIIPEIEMPGHSQAAISAYPELGCTGRQVDVATKWGVFEHIYCSKEQTFEFLEAVLDEVIALFPSEYIHIGGDEAPKTNWKACSECQKRIRSEGLKDEHELQNYFISRIESYLNSKGRQIIGWDEILEGGLAPNATVMSWRGMNGAIEAAKKKHQVIMTPTSHCYFDYYQSDNENEPLAIGGFLPLEKVYHFNPIPEELNREESKYVLGAQGNIWTEYMPTDAKVEYMAFPRILAMCEVLWSNEDQKNYSHFVERLENFHERLEALNINYANHLYEVEGHLVSTQDGVFYKLETLTKNKDIRFSTDGTEPTFESSLYDEQIWIDSDTDIRAAVFKKEKKLGATFEQNINFHKAVGQKIKLNVEPHSAYSGSGKNGLINGIVGSDNRYGDKEWLGFWGDDLRITIDFEDDIEVTSIKTRFHNGQGQWIYAPKEIIIEFITEDQVISKLIKINAGESIIANINEEFEKIRAKTIIFKIPNFGIIPEKRQGAGNKAWTFIDEISIN
ncbi:MAG: beta-N-acetylhexosaminidase [Flavobacteriaceae bacterium]|nr:MAG: beta-N-acetylhexosaminidase [Flavobacteriaceae bacterium]